MNTADYPILQAVHKSNSFSQQFHPPHNSFYITVCLQTNSIPIFLQIRHFLNFITSCQIRQTLNENYSQTFHCFLQSLHLPKHYYFELPIKILLTRNKNQKIRHPCGKPLLWYALMQKKCNVLLPQHPCSSRSRLAPFRLPARKNKQ
jgi:hypothetical protein